MVSAKQVDRPPPVESAFACHTCKFTCCPADTSINRMRRTSRGAWGGIVVAQGLKHFAIVGLVFALALGWLLTLVANTVLGNALEAILHRPPDDFYWGALLLTAVSMSLITVATLVGTRVARSRGWLVGLSKSALTLSSALFVALVLAFNVPSLAELAQRFYEHMSYTYEHPGEAWMMLSLPLVRLVGLPVAYVFIGRTLFGPTQAGPTARVAA